MTATKRKFTLVLRSIWRSQRFGSLKGTDPRLLYFYFLTCRHQTSIGCFHLPDAYAADDLGWSIADYLEARAEVIRVGLIDFDASTFEVAIDRYIQNNPPANNSHATGMQALIENIESDRLREKLEAEFTAAEELRLAAASKPGRGLDTTAYMGGRR